MASSASTCLESITAPGPRPRSRLGSPALLRLAGEGFHRLRRDEALQRGRVLVLDPAQHRTRKFSSGKPKILVYYVDLRPEEVEQRQRLFRDDIHVAADHQ